MAKMGFIKVPVKSITEDLRAGKYPNTYTSWIQKHSQLEENKKSNHFRSKRKQYQLKMLPEFNGAILN